MKTPMPQASWQSNHPISLACDEAGEAKTYRIKIVNQHEMSLRSLRFFSEAPNGKWTILRIGHVNAGQKNGPAPPEGTGWECDKLSVSSQGRFDG